MNDISKLVPKNKHDTSVIDTLKHIDIEDVEPILGRLLEWIQDLNWPVARELVDVLPRFHKQLVPHIQFVFNSDDDIWKYWVLSMLRQFPQETVELLSEDIKRIVNSPTETEILEEVDEHAREIVEQFGL